MLKKTLETVVDRVSLRASIFWGSRGHIIVEMNLHCSLLCDKPDVNSSTIVNSESLAHLARTILP